MKKTIDNRADISLLVTTFYKKIRADSEIGFYFNETVVNWEEHVTKLTDFWETNLFPVKKYSGNPIEAHNKVDKHFGNQISSHEFGIWLNLWFETLDELFLGENVDVLKRRARKMSTFLYMNMFESRTKV